MVEIPITKIAPKDRKKKPEPGTELVFGKTFTDHMFLMEYQEGEGWKNPRIEPYRLLSLEPAALIFFYAQETFEGLKAYRWAKGEICLFRPRKNFERMNRSAKRLCIPELDMDLALEATRQLIRLEKDWVPSSPGYSLYVRPNLIATEPALGVRPSKQYLFYIILSPVAKSAIFAKGFDTVDIYVTEKYIRAARGGLGEAKTASNYAHSLLAAEEAKALGYNQVLWLDAVERKYAEEVGMMNIFFYINDELITAALDGTVLPGITRDSVLHIARQWGLKVAERKISIEEIISAIESGKLKEIFGCGTAAVIAPVGRLAYLGKTHIISGRKVGPLAQKLYDHIVGIQFGNIKDPYGWMEKVV